MSGFNPVFCDCVERLLASKVVCQVTCEDAFLYLNHDTNLQKVREYLYPLGKTVLATRDLRGFYCAYLDATPGKTKTSLKAQFARTVNDWEGIVAWMRLARGLSGNSRPITALDTLRESELLAAIEGAPSIRAQLDDVVHKLKQRSAPESKYRLKAVLNYLESRDFLRSSGPTGSVYIATAKWSVLYDQMEFIMQHEGIPVADRDGDEDQAEMF